MYTKKLLYVLAGAIILSLICTGLYALNIFNLACRISSEWCDIDNWVTSYQSGTLDTPKDITPPAPVEIGMQDTYYTGVTADQIDTLPCRDVPFQKFEAGEIKTIAHPLSFVSWWINYYRCPNRNKNEYSGYDTIVSYSWKTLYLKDTNEYYDNLKILSDEYIWLQPDDTWGRGLQIFSVGADEATLAHNYIRWDNIQVSKDNEFIFACADESNWFQVYDFKSWLHHVTSWSNTIDNDTWDIYGQLLEMKIAPKDGDCYEKEGKIYFATMSCTNVVLDTYLGLRHECQNPSWNYKMVYNLDTRKLYKDGIEVKRNPEFTGKHTRVIYMSEEDQHGNMPMTTPDKQYQYICGSGSLYATNWTVKEKWEVEILDTNDNFTYNIVRYLGEWQEPDNWKSWYIEDCNMVSEGDDYKLEFRTSNFVTKVVDSYSFDFKSKSLMNLGTKDIKVVTPLHVIYWMNE